MHHLFTVGHSTHPLDEFVTMLHAHGVAVVADVRTVPKSRHNPQFTDTALSGSLPASSIGYRHIARLGGLRRPSKNSINGGWNNASFRGYADYMQTAAFADGLEELIELSREAATVVMCAEAVPWRCHRSLIADALLVRGFAVDDILSQAQVRPHSLTRFAHVDDIAVTYPPEDTE